MVGRRVLILVLTIGASALQNSSFNYKNYSFNCKNHSFNCKNRTRKNFTRVPDFKLNLSKLLSKTFGVDGVPEEENGRVSEVKDVSKHEGLFLAETAMTRLEDSTQEDGSRGHQRSLSCPAWCSKNSENWAQKCQWDRCKGCPTCKPKAMLSCPKWCSSNEKAWTAKCKWDGCKACGSCKPKLKAAKAKHTHRSESTSAAKVRPGAQKKSRKLQLLSVSSHKHGLTGTSKTESENSTFRKGMHNATSSCPAWCSKSKREWSVKCEWKRCKACGSCDAMAMLSCPSWCSRLKPVWSVKCGWDRCKACGPCDISDASAALHKLQLVSVQTRVLHKRGLSGASHKAKSKSTVKGADNREDENATLNCQSWCSGTKHDWSVKCEWDKCKGCGSCGQKAMLSCPSWCGRISQAWSVKCDWDQCSTCGSCGTQALLRCPAWCAGLKPAWSVKCGWDKCKACGSCEPELKAATSKQTPQPVLQANMSQRHQSEPKHSSETSPQAVESQSHRQDWKGNAEVLPQANGSRPRKQELHDTSDTVPQVNESSSVVVPQEVESWSHKQTLNHTSDTVPQADESWPHKQQPKQVSNSLPEATAAMRKLQLLSVLPHGRKVKWGRKGGASQALENRSTKAKEDVKKRKPLPAAPSRLHQKASDKNAAGRLRKPKKR